MTDLAALKAAAERATPGPWNTDSIDNEGCYGSGPNCEHGFNSYAVGCGPDENWKVVVDTLNSDVAMIEVEYDEDGTHAWDEVGKRNAEFIALANPAAILSLIAMVERYEAALKQISRQTKTTEIETEYDEAFANLEDGYDLCIDRARAALGDHA